MAPLLDDKTNEQLAFLNQLRANGVYAYSLDVTSSCQNRMIVGGKERINFISNNYLGFSTHPKVLEAALSAVRKYGIGIGGSPLACGTTDLHLRLREKIAKFYGRESCALFASGYQALLGSIQIMLGPGQVALLDSLVHRSIVDGVILSRADSRSWMHNDVEDLEYLLKSTAKKYPRRMVVVDSVYSMDGDIAHLPEIKKLCDLHGALLMIDEAHSLGVIGERGGGLEDHFGLSGSANVISGTFSKFAGAVGGFAVGSKDLIDALQHGASPFVFSASLPPVIAASVLKSFELLEEEPQIRQQLRENVQFMLDGLHSLGFDTGLSQTPVIPIMIRDTEKTMLFNKLIYSMGIYASPVVYPGVAPTESRIRLGVMATHTRADLTQSLEIFARAKKEVGF